MACSTCEGAVNINCTSQACPVQHNQAFGESCLKETTEYREIKNQATDIHAKGQPSIHPNQKLIASDNTLRREKPSAIQALQKKRPTG
jgi:hypothetical protein